MDERLVMSGIFLLRSCNTFLTKGSAWGRLLLACFLFTSPKTHLLNSFCTKTLGNLRGKMVEKINAEIMVEKCVVE